MLKFKVISKISDLNGESDKDTILFFDAVGLGNIADSLKVKGFRVYGGGRLNDILELNRDFGIRIAKSSGLKTPQWEKFDSLEKTKDFFSEGKWSFNSQDKEVAAFAYDCSGNGFEKIWSMKTDFIIQEKIEGVGVSIGMFYLDGIPIENTLNTSVCSVLRFWKKQEPKLYNLTLKKIETFIKRFKYSGYLNCNCVISEKDKLLYFSGWKAYLKHDIICALCEGLNQKIDELIENIVNRNKLPKPSYEWIGTPEDLSNAENRINILKKLKYV